MLYYQTEYGKSNWATKDLLENLIKVRSKRLFFKAFGQGSTEPCRRDIQRGCQDERQQRIHKIQQANGNETFSCRKKTESRRFGYFR